MHASGLGFGEFPESILNTGCWCENPVCYHIISALTETDSGYTLGDDSRSKLRQNWSARATLRLLTPCFSIKFKFCWGTGKKGVEVLPTIWRHEVFCALVVLGDITWREGLRQGRSFVRQCLKEVAGAVPKTLWGTDRRQKPSVECAVPAWTEPKTGKTSRQAGTYTHTQTHHHHLPSFSQCSVSHLEDFACQQEKQDKWLDRVCVRVCERRCQPTNPDSDDCGGPEGRLLENYLLR